MTQFHAGRPAFVDVGAEKTRVAAQLKVRVGISAVGAVVEFAFATLIQHAETTFQALIKTMVEVQREGIIAVGIVVAVGAHTAVRMVDAAGVVSAGARSEERRGGDES